MKLAAAQIEKIEKYLLDFGLAYRDFYEEMLDHFVLSIENDLEKGFDFESAFENTKGQFAKKRYRAGLLAPFRYGIKALELEVAKEKEKLLRRTVWMHYIKQFSTKGTALWLAFLGFMSYIGQQYGYEKGYFPAYFVLMITVFVQVYFMPKSAVWTNFLYWFEKHSSPERRKKKTLFPCMDVVILREISSSLIPPSLFIPLLVVNMGAVPETPLLHYLLYTFLLLITIYQFVVFKMAYQAYQKTMVNTEL